MGGRGHPYLVQGVARDIPRQGLRSPCLLLVAATLLLLDPPRCLSRLCPKPYRSTWVLRGLSLQAHHKYHPRIRLFQGGSQGVNCSFLVLVRRL
ncbi:hypothetical protein AMTR_s00047p00191390 [Amborella trichopoda]|uniref:Uncharacterized protein n=1 Tax=Amborella trichopoda TaxID=13333 RepID=U5D6G4_AMBTC|nr:hypothetical protein AMTR_s00047p00191390 [Amborella trichopoda]